MHGCLFGSLAALANKCAACCTSSVHELHTVQAALHDFMKVVLDPSCRTPTALESSPEDSPGDLTTKMLAERHVTSPAAITSAAP